MASKSKFAVYATALLLIVGLALVPLFFAGARLWRIESEPAAAKPSAPATPDTVEAPAENPAAPPDVVAQKDELRAEYAKQKANMPAEVAKPIEDDIGVIEGGAADLLAAIAHEPDNENLKMMLIETYRNEMKLLKKALHLSSGDDQNADEEPVAATK